MILIASSLSCSILPDRTRLSSPASTTTDGRCGSVSAARHGETAPWPLEGAPQSGTHRRILPLARYPVRACCTAESTFVSCGNLTQPCFATIRSPTQTVNSPRSPSTNEAV
jgi:hypothetical protein